MGEVATLQRGNDLPKSQRTHGSYPVIGSNGIVGYHSKAVACGPGVLVGRSGSVGKVTWVEQDYWPLNTALWVKDFHDNDPEFVYYLLDFIDLSKFAAGVSVPTLNRNLVHPVKVATPHLPEQRAIANVLRTVQEAIQTTEQVIEASRELKRSLMNHLFTYGPVPVDEAEQVPLKETEIGLVPEHWTVLRLRDVAKTTSGGTPSRKNSAYYGGSIPWVKSGELDDSMVTSTSETITEEGLANSSAKVFPPGILLVAMYGATAGKVGILGVQGATNQAVCAVIPNDQTSPEYLFYSLTSKREELLGERYGGAQPNLSQTVLRNFALPIPPILEQEQIVNALSSVDTKIRVEETRKASLDILFKALLHNLMTGKVRVDSLDLSLMEEMV